MAIEIVDFPIKNGDFPWQNVSSPEGISIFISLPISCGVISGFMHKLHTFQFKRKIPGSRSEKTTVVLCQKKLLSKNEKMTRFSSAQ